MAHKQIEISKIGKKLVRGYSLGDSEKIVNFGPLTKKL